MLEISGLVSSWQLWSWVLRSMGVCGFLRFWKLSASKGVTKSTLGSTNKGRLWHCRTVNSSLKGMTWPSGKCPRELLGSWSFSLGSLIGAVSNWELLVEEVGLESLACSETLVVSCPANFWLICLLALAISRFLISSDIPAPSCFEDSGLTTNTILFCAIAATGADVP